jgi:hypothetical protein
MVVPSGRSGPAVAVKMGAQSGGAEELRLGCSGGCVFERWRWL